MPEGNGVILIEKICFLMSQSVFGIMLFYTPNSRNQTT
jgi:hypothetical protein